MRVYVTQFQGGVSTQESGILKDNVTGSYFTPYVTTIGLYNAANELLVVGKLGQPFPVPKNTDVTFVVRWDS